MKITVEFNSLQEINDFCAGVFIAPGLAQAAREQCEAAEEAPKKAEVKKSSPKAEKAQEEAQTIAEEPSVSTETVAEAKPEPEKAPTEIVKPAELRKLLAAVNKKTGTNTASQWIKELTGKEKLTEVTDPAELSKLAAKAKEVLNAE